LSRGPGRWPGRGQWDDALAACGEGHDRSCAHPIQSLRSFCVASHPGGQFDLYGARVLCGSFSLFPEFGAAAAIRSVGTTYASRHGRLLPVGRMLHFRYYRCGADFWLSWPGIGGCAVGHCDHRDLDSASQAFIHRWPIQAMEAVRAIAGSLSASMQMLAERVL